MLIREIVEPSPRQEINEWAALLPALVAGARAVAPVIGRVGPALRGLMGGAAKVAPPIAGGVAQILPPIAKSAPPVATALGIWELFDTVSNAIGTAANRVFTDHDEAKAFLANVISGVPDQTLGSLAMMAVKYALPIGIVLAVLYGGKKLIDRLLSDESPAAASPA